MGPIQLIFTYTLLAVYTVLPRPRLFVTPPSQMPGGGIDKKGGGGGLL